MKKNLVLILTALGTLLFAAASCKSGKTPDNFNEFDQKSNEIIKRASKNYKDSITLLKGYSQDPGGDLQSKMKEKYDTHAKLVIELKDLKASNPEMEEFRKMFLDLLAIYQENMDAVYALVKKEKTDSVVGEIITKNEVEIKSLRSRYEQMRDDYRKKHSLNSR